MLFVGYMRPSAAKSSPSSCYYITEMGNFGNIFVAF